MNDKYLISVFISGTLLLFLFAFFIVVYLLVQKQKQNAYQMEKDRMIFNHQNNILKIRIEEQENTMDQISREIHDHIGQMLNFTKMNMFAIARKATDEEQTILIEKVKDLLDQLIKDVRNISHSLNGDFIKGNGLTEVLNEELNYIHLSQDIRCNLEIIGEHTVLDSAKELLIYRIAQEAIHNISKHAHAKQLEIKLIYNTNSFTMIINDDGVGFDTKKIYELNGIGFLNMFYRAKLLNGSLNIQSELSKGSTITLEMDSARETDNQ